MNHLHESPLRGLLPRGGGEGGSASEAEPDEGSNLEFRAPIRPQQQFKTTHQHRSFAIPGTISRASLIVSAMLMLLFNESEGRAQDSEKREKASALSPAKVKQTIERALGFLARDAVAWKKEHDCSSCHHAAMVVWSMNEAKSRGYAVEESVLADMTTWLTEAGEGKTSVPRPAGVPKALNSKAVYYAIGLRSVPEPTVPQRDALKLLLRTVVDDQTATGAWASWPETRPPFFGNSDESMSALATLALFPEATENNPSAKAAWDKGLRWMDQTDTDGDPQSIALRLVLYAKLKRPRSQLRPLVRQIQERQRRDGGWSQTADGPSDAWATGQAMYALGYAGKLSDKRVLRLGRAFLVNSQREDGSWPMKSRPQKPGGEGAGNLIPIIGGGSAWAVLGLTRSEDRR